MPFKSTLLDLSSRLARTLPPVGRSLVAAVSGLEDSLRAFSQLSVCFSDSNCSHRSADASSRGRDHSELENLSLLLGLRCGTTVLCGFFPGIRGTPRQLAQSLAQTSHTQVSARNPVQWALVSVKGMLAVILLTGAGLLLRGLEELSRVSPGFDPSHVLTFQVTGSWGETANMGNLVQRIDHALDGLQALPGVDSAATAAKLPGIPGLYQMNFKIDGRLDENRKILADSRYVSVGYFDTMGDSFLLGETCRERPNATDLLVNRSFADRYFADASPVGHHLQAASYNDFMLEGTIRGVVGEPTVYSCFSAPTPFPNYLVHTKGNPSAMADAIRRRIHKLEPARSIYGMMPPLDQLDEASFENRLRTLLPTLFAGSAVLLSCIGIYGTLNYLGRLRQREVGMRLALGALRHQIVMRFLLRGLPVTLFGCTRGLLLSLGARHFLESMPYGVSSLDPGTYGGVFLLILVVATTASLIPAGRAAMIEPVRVLREE